MSVLASRHRIALQIQRCASWANALWFIGFFSLLFRWYARYTCTNLDQIRLRSKQLIEQAGDRPIIICANHLTMIDSMIINWLMFSFTDYLKNWRLMPWNMPEFLNFAGNIPMRIFCYLGKCLYVERGGKSSDRRLTIERFKQLLTWRELICIFPEGTRSRTGRVKGSQPTYGVGDLCQQLPDAIVLCVYVRGYGQSSYGHFPKRHENFYMDLELLAPNALSQGRRGSKEIAEQIMFKLGEMEDRFFASPQENPTATAT